MPNVHRCVLAAVIASACLTTVALAMGGKYSSDEQIRKQDGWPAALPTAINSSARVAGHWVNANDEFFYRGDDKAFREFMQRVADTKLPLTLVLHTNKQRHSLLWGDEPHLAYDWSLLVGTAGWASPEWKLNFDDPKVKNALRLDVWLDSGRTVDTINLPSNVRLSVDSGSPATPQPSGAAR